MKLIPLLFALMVGVLAVNFEERLNKIEIAIFAIASEVQHTCNPTR